ncbi:putative receptor-like protein kinase [Acorus gramineus]|uniref:RING-type E3 ubiquitin transferase n=1 Tax=Acorus gramineus TaxID=55184 RepID=A0AAV9BT99_ACOGR|nr:putative receptor-like protein kinase [Acorus gramineus]
MSLFLAIFIIFHLLHSTKGQTDDGFFKICPPKKCGDEGPLIRFPFRLDSQPRSCSLNTTQLSCSGNTTLLNLPWSGNFTVTAIDYLHNIITIKGRDSWSKCPLQGFLSLNFTSTVFIPLMVSLVSCPRNSSWIIPDKVVGPIPCLSDDPNQSIYAASGFLSMDVLPDICEKYSKADDSFSGIRGYFDCTFACAIDKLMATREVKLWYDSDCYTCEENGDFCGWNQTTDTVVCVFFSGTSVGAILILSSILVVIIYITKRSEKEKELRLKIEAFLAGYNTTKLTRYTLTDLKKITKKEVGGNDAEIAKKLAIVALWCVQCNPADRPCMSRVINMLEGDLQSLSMPPNPFA